MSLKNRPFSTEKSVKFVILVVAFSVSVYAGYKLGMWIVDYSIGKFMG
jgi:hypothetical protein